MNATDVTLVEEGIEIGRRLDEVKKDLARVAIAYGVERAPEFAQKIGVLKTEVDRAVQQAMKSGTTISARRADPVRKSEAVG